MNGTKGKMAEAFKDLVCRKSFQKITISDITKKSAMTRENFYYHFRDKYDIMRWIFETEIVSALPPKEEPFEKWMESLFENTEKDYKYYRKLAKSLDVDEMWKDLRPVFEERVRIMVDEATDDDLWNMRQEKEEFATVFFTDAFLGFYIDYVRSHEEVDPDILRTGMDFLFGQFLSFVRNSKEFTETQKKGII